MARPQSPRRLIPIFTVPRKLLGQHWRLDDVSLSLNGDMIALSGENKEYQTFVRVISCEPGNEGNLLYENDYEEGIGSPTWYGWRISFMEHDRGEVLVTCWDNQAEVIDFNRRVVLATGTLMNPLTTCMSVSGRQIFIGRNSNTITIYDEQLNRKREITLRGLPERDYPCDIAAVGGELLVCTHDGKAGIYLQADGTKQGDYSIPQNRVISIAKNNEPGQREVVAVLWSGNIAVYYSNGQVSKSYYVDPTVSIIRINRGKIVTGSQESKTVEISHLFQEINLEKPRHGSIRQPDDSQSDHLDRRQVVPRNETGSCC